MNFKLINRILFFIVLSCCLIGCNSVKVQQQAQKINKSHTVELGAIIEEQNQNPFNPKISILGNPEYKISVPLKMVKIKPSDIGYKKIKKLSEKFKENDTINTTFKKIGYTAVSIQFKDKIKILENVSTVQNTKVLEYIKNKPNSKLVTSISGILPTSVCDKLAKAKTIHFISAKKNIYEFLIYSEEKEEEKILINNNLDVLTYNSEYFCWGANKKRRLVLKDMVLHKCDCGKGTSIKALKIEKNLEYDKF